MYKDSIGVMTERKIWGLLPRCIKWPNKDFFQKESLIWYDFDACITIHSSFVDMHLQAHFFSLHNWNSSLNFTSSFYISLRTLFLELWNSSLTSFSSIKISETIIPTIHKPLSNDVFDEFVPDVRQHWDYYLHH